MRSRGFAPVHGERARVLVLGTLPGQLSLAAGEYYAYPRNQFWQIMEHLFQWPANTPYRNRTEHLVSAGVALWDVCEVAHRPGSLDTSIDSASIMANDFRTFFRKHPDLQLICFNGAKAAALYSRKVLPELPEPFKSIRRETLPSTSPANASMPYEEKLLRWALVKSASES